MFLPWSSFSSPLLDGSAHQFMRAMVLRGHGDLSMLELADVPDPEISRHVDVRIALQAGALNHLDLFTWKGSRG